MPPFTGMPYGAAPAYCLPLTELCMYVLFVLCLVHAVKRGMPHICYLLGGLLFGLCLEYINVNSNMGYTYGKFIIMFGKAPADIPLCIGIGWSIIMYSSRLFTDAFNLSLWAAVAFDALLAINIDVSMDTVAYRLHMWHWNWSDTGLNPLTADWFGIPYGNFFGWLMVVFFYSSSSRLLERASAINKKAKIVKSVFVPLLSLGLSQAALYIMLVYVDQYLADHFGITSKHRFISFLVILLVMAAIGFRKKRETNFASLPLVSWLVAAWFHLYFFIWLFLGGFYRENPWLTTTACLSLIIGFVIHVAVIKIRTSSAFNKTAFNVAELEKG